MTNPFVNPWTEPTAQTSSIFLEPLPNPYREQMTPREVGLANVPSSEAMQAAADRIAGSPWFWVWRLASAAGAVSGAYHGYKRNGGSIGWAIGWFLLGGLFPMFTIPVSLAQGYGKPRGGGKRKKNRGRGQRRRNGEFLVERFGGIISAPSEAAARATAERRMKAGETWTRIWRVGPGGATTLVGRYGRQQGGRGAVARRLNRRRRRNGRGRGGR